MKQKLSLGVKRWICITHMEYNTTFMVGGMPWCANCSTFIPLPICSENTSERWKTIFSTFHNFINSLECLACTSCQSIIREFTAYKNGHILAFQFLTTIPSLPLSMMKCFLSSHYKVFPNATCQSHLKSFWGDLVTNTDMGELNIKFISFLAVEIISISRVVLCTPTSILEKPL